jgi:hypothetical protein
MKFLISLLFLLVFISLCSQQPAQDIKQQAIFSCIQMCKSTSKNLDYANGPCLSDNSSDWNVSDWVCDIAHSPRQDVDNLPENQCSAFREGKATHFVEVDTSCNLIRAV